MAAFLPKRFLTRAPLKIQQMNLLTTSGERQKNIMLTPRGMHLDPPLSVPGTIDNHTLDLNSSNLPPEWTYALDQYKSDIKGNDTLVHRVHKYEINPSNLR